MRDSGRQERHTLGHSQMHTTNFATARSVFRVCRQGQADRSNGGVNIVQGFLATETRRLNGVGHDKDTVGAVTAPQLDKDNEGERGRGWRKW